jgi:transposase InsO family protein
MRNAYPKVSLSTLCGLFGVSRQAYYEADNQFKKTNIAHMIVLTLVKDLRSNIPMLGTRKLQVMLSDELERHGIKIGRDKLFDLLRFHGLLMRRRRRMVKTTNSYHWLKKYPNLTIGMELCCSELLWVSDITYVRTLTGFSYLSLITDAYSRKVVGYCLYETLEADGPIEALKMAIDNRHKRTSFILTHHSDRGVQYCSEEYVEILRKEGIAISMTQTGSPYDNAVAERVNGTIKNDFLPVRLYRDHTEAKRHIAQVVQKYNQLRPHASIDYLTPEQAHARAGILPKRWKTYRKIYKKKEVPKNELV